MKIENPWRQNPWFESVAVAQRRARKRLPAPVYDALVAGSERGQTAAENEQAFRELGLAPHVAGNPPVRSLASTLVGQRYVFTTVADAVKFSGRLYRNSRL